VLGILGRPAVRLCLRGYSGPGIWDCPITRHHQIHPAKLATDLTAELVSVALIWQRRYVLGLVAHLVPPIVASAVLTRRRADLERLRGTRASRHVRSEMTPPIVALRVIGDVLTVVGAWRHRPAVIAEGALGLSRLDPRTAVPRSVLLTRSSDHSRRQDGVGRPGHAHRSRSRRCNRTRPRRQASPIR
jgi:hypothetical protein